MNRASTPDCVINSCRLPHLIMGSFADALKQRQEIPASRWVGRLRSQYERQRERCKKCKLAETGWRPGDAQDALSGGLANLRSEATERVASSGESTPRRLFAWMAAPAIAPCLVEIGE
jgi:hypothetical protein